MPEEKDYFKIRGVSSHTLQYFEESPLSFKKKLDEELEEDDKKYLEFGKQVHMRILEPKRFKQSYTVLDYDTPKSEQQKQFCEDYVGNNDLLVSYSNNYKVTTSDEKVLVQATLLKDKLSKYIEYLSKRKKYKDILTFAKKQKIDTCYAECVKHKAASKLLFDNEFSTDKTYNELEILWKHPLYPEMQCKSMIDRLIVDETNKVIKIVDIKTAISFKNFKDQFKEFNYARQMSFYIFAAFYYLMHIEKINVEDYHAEVYLVVIKHQPHTEVKIIQLSEESINKAIYDIEVLFRDIYWHWTADLWDYSKEYYEGNGIEKIE
jgi:hypothetical protein